ncbi:MAG TPA: thioredoxin domain-containing protein [Phycisphaerae bacterium]|nr:thioredoxin domain-containing protein [Phycisphaerae bacterium]
MNWITRSALVVTILASPLLAGEGLFVSSSFDDACAKAKVEGKLVFIDFYTTWCGPCKIMDKTTFTDETVIKWLGENTIPLKIDAEKEVALAAKYRIDSYPSLLFVKPDGEVAGLLSGVHEPEAFLAEANAIKSGKSPMERAKEKLEAKGENDPMARMDYAESLVRMGKYEEALSEYLWCYDHGSENMIGFIGVKNSFLLSNIARLGKRHPPALDELRKRRDVAYDRVINEAPKKASLWSMLGGGNTDFPAMDVAALNEYLGEEDKTLELYDKLRQEHPDWPAVDMLRRSVFDLLMKKKRYAEIVESTDIEKEIRDRLKRKEEMRMFMPKEQLEEFEAMDRRMIVEEIAKYYEVLMGVEDVIGAARLADQALEIDDSEETYNLLAWHGYLSGKPIPANVTQAQKAFEMSNESSAAILDTLVRVLDALDKTKEACELLSAKEAKFESERDRALIKSCQQDFGC